jgi:hypothetical protein
MSSVHWCAPRALSCFALLATLSLLPLGGTCLAQVSFLLDDMQGDAERLEQSLRRRGSIDAVQMPLRDFADWLSQEFGVPVVLAPKKLEEAGVNVDSPITKRLESTPLEAILWHSLSELELTFTVRNHVILITTPEDAESELITRVYPVRDLVAYSTDAEKSGYGEDYDSLIELITTTIAPQSWDEVGGPGAISEFANASSLVISQSRDVHRAIEPLLVRLRQVKGLQGLRSAAVGDTAASSHLAKRRIAGRPASSMPARMAAPSAPAWQLPQVHGSE